MEPTQFNEAQKKHLEKVYLKIFENNQVTDEGKYLCREAQIKPEDVKVKNIEEFKAEVQVEDVAMIRYNHYQQKRLRKLNKVSKVMENIAHQKQQEAHLAEQKRADQEHLVTRPGTTGTLFPSASQYQASLKKGFNTKKLAFYNSAKSDFNERQPRYMSETAGFFNIRQNRNNTNSMGVTTKSFNNYVRARERAESIAKSYLEKQNLIALTKAKNQKLVEKEVKMREAVRKDQLEKLHEKQKQIKIRRDNDVREKEKDAYRSYKENITEIKERLKQKEQKDKELSVKAFNQLFVDKDEFEDKKSQMSRTQQSLWGRNPGKSVGPDQVVYELQNVEDKLNRGFSNSVMMRNLKTQKIRQHTTRVPDTVEQIKKKNEEQKFAVWENYLLKQRDIQKYQKKQEKEAKGLAEAVLEKKNEKLMKIKTNIKQNAIELNEKARAINQKWKKIEKKVDSAEQKKKIFCLKHRELDNLRFEDLNENLDILKSEKIKQNLRIEEKHFALTAMNSDKKSYLTTANDRQRSRIVKERQLANSDQKVFPHAQKQYLHPATVIPDVVKWNPKDIKKLIQGDKKDN